MPCLPRYTTRQPTNTQTARQHDIQTQISDLDTKVTKLDTKVSARIDTMEQKIKERFDTMQTENMARLVSCLSTRQPTNAQTARDQNVMAAVYNSKAGPLVELIPLRTPTNKEIPNFPRLRSDVMNLTCKENKYMGGTQANHTMAVPEVKHLSKAMGLPMSDDKAVMERNLRLKIGMKLTLS